MKKRIFCLLLVLLMMVQMLPLYTVTRGAEDYGAYVGGTAQFNPEQNIINDDGICTAYGTAYLFADPSKEQNFNNALSFSGLMNTVFVIDAVYVDETVGVWYKLSAAPGSQMPTAMLKMPWVFQNDLPTPYGIDTLVITPPAVDPGEPVYPSMPHPESGVVVTAESFPEGVALTVRDTDVSACFDAYNIPESKKVFGLDISLTNTDNTEYQPNGALVKVPVTAPVGTMIGLVHEHNGKVAFLGVAEVLTDGTIEFYTDGFSSFAGFTVDFHYNGVDFSIEGLTSILLSDLFAALGIEEDAYAAQNVVFSNNELVTTQRQESGDWLLTSQQAFDSQETLIITFTDGRTIVIGVTDASWATDDVWSKDATFYYYKTDNNWAINTNRVTMNLYLYNASYPGDPGKTQAKHSKMDRVYKNNTAILSITDAGKGSYWFYGTSSNLSLTDDYFQFKVAIGKNDGTVNVERISRNIYVHEAFQLVTVTQKRYAGITAVDRTVKVFVNGTEVTEARITKKFPSRGAAVAASQLDIQYIPSTRYFYGDYANLTECRKDSNGNYVDTEGYYYSYSGGDTGTYSIPIYSRFNIVFNGNGATSGSMAKQQFIWGKPQTLNANQYSRIYTVTFDPAGGVCNTKTDTAEYTFTGWKDSASKSYTNKQANVQNLTSDAGADYHLYAQWQPDSITLPTPEARKGYTFKGWSYGTKIYAAGATFTPEQNLTMVAVWEPLSYTIKYLPNGGTGAAMADQSVKFDSNVTIKSNGYTAPKGHQFLGWSTKNDNTDDGYKWTGWSGKWTYINGQYGINNQLLNLYARWGKKTFTVNYIANGGTGTMDSQQILFDSAFKIKDNTFVAPNGKQFAGWGISANGAAHEGGWSNADKTGYAGTWTWDNGEYGIVSDTLNLYAIWEDDRYTVTWKNWDGTILRTDTVAHNGSVSYGGAQPTKPDEKGYTYEFIGWDKLTDNLTGDIEVTAQYNPKPISYTATFDYNGGVAGVASKDFTIESTWTLPELTKTGYAGTWKVTQADGNWVVGEEYAPGSSITGKYGNVTMVAQWKEQYRYVLKFDANGGNNPPQTIVIDWCDSNRQVFAWDFNLNPTREGYIFLGWAESAASQNNIAGSNYNTYTVTGQKTETVEKTLYAIWQRQTGDLKLTFNGSNTAPAVVTVSGQGLKITVVITDAETVIKDLPTGEYTVTAESGSAQMKITSVSDNTPNVLDGKTTVVDIKIGYRILSWFAAFFRVKNQCS